MIRDRSQLPALRRVVVKVGSSSITGQNEPALNELTAALAKLAKSGVQVIVVTSGAIATGMPLVGVSEKPQDLATNQALAAIGQSRLIARYQSGFSTSGLVVAQVLLTDTDLKHQGPRQNAKQAFLKLLELGVIPVVNENDTVATEEIRFGDNDRLGALVAELLEADLLLLLSDIDALYDRPPSEAGAARIDTLPFDFDTSAIRVEGSSTKVGTGGAVTKLAAATLATEAGCAVLLSRIADLDAALAGESVGTWFTPRVG